jgi:hypothetical protein
MKKSLLILALAITGITGSAFAAGIPTVNNRVLNTFSQEFRNATEVKWEQRDHFIKASFVMNQMTLYAYFLPDGDLLAVTRFISPAQLPIRLATTLKKDYHDYWISDLFEINDGSDTYYYVTIENASSVTVLKSTAAGGWGTYQTTVKP